MKWKEFSVLTEGVCVDAIAGIFHKLGSGGVVIEDPQAARQYIANEKWDTQSVSPDFLDHEFVVVKAYFPDERDVKAELQACLQSVEDNFCIKCKVFIDEVRSEDWEQSWKKYYHTFKIGDRLVIKPAWEDYVKNPEEIVIDIDPGMAFGTGIHASTRFCLTFLDQYIKGGEEIIDAGCGSGILSIAAVKMGAKHVYAMDVDEVAARISGENVRLNNLQDKIEVYEGNIVDKLRNEDMKADVVLANITAEVVYYLIPEAARALSAGGYFFGSGIVEGRWPGVKKQLEDCGFEIEQVLTDVEWIGVAARRL
ncbi:MAG TPA: 50S ribosomal protein L11 methyltransferase [Syntrophomonas sp.]|jgi:ribosomal protein L11 methyltransferase|nr:50S ribosomal protein L11 methyltransferase [Syntrophomonas sp.]